ncbi:hypothetical protein [Pengzhenrongella phosphoraccumulans]|jgi:hypothetical protein|uniref:hypothetical protein n=1 Tax=Pengzhenrongella phosphoraccumulans TaxID=3114394 RepID=UPI00388F2BB0
MSSSSASRRQPPLSRPTSALALGGLITALLAIPFVSLALSLMAFKETKTGVKGGHGIAVAGAIIGGLVTAVWTLFILLIVVSSVSGP